ncbi:hypothetical protein C5468_01405 [Photorhabdus luminescens subsp. mexicana]|uniref:Uncharacterized protein n=1 Tax=Photorhabdus luminescens subsp. mexicana TaxID=2100167 RepID=A0A4R4JPH2_PHOLU|nr:hypothetical protein C5468_01405 [Photorhabdus luminescens subsp. mexicana]
MMLFIILNKINVIVVSGQVANINFFYFLFIAELSEGGGDINQCIILSRKFVYRNFSGVKFIDGI